MEILKRIPHWLRWILFMPMSILAVIIINPLVIIGNRLTGLGTNLWELLMVWSIGALCSGAIFVWMGATIAPKAKFLIALIMTILYNSCGAIALFSKYLLGAQSNTSWIEMVIYFLLGLVASITMCYAVHENSNFLSK